MRVSMLAITIVAFLAAPVSGFVAQEDGWRTIQFETREATDPDVAVSRDGQWLVFTMVGKLFRLPVEGGDAEQLTFGPYFDTKPAISPDGALVAFQSDRDASAGNIFVLELASGEIVQVTHEPWAGRPRWTPDGQALVYVRFERDAWYIPTVVPRRPPPPAVVRRIPFHGGEPETLRPTVGEVRSVFHLPDGRVAWAVVERDTTSPRAQTFIDVLEADGTVSTLRTVDGVADRVVASPAGDGLYARRYIPLRMQHDVSQQRELVFVPLPEGPERPIFPVSGIRGYNYSGEPRFAVGADNQTLYAGNLGHLWKVNLPSGPREHIPFRASVTLAIREPTPPPEWIPIEPGDRASIRTIMEPRLSPDGSFVVFEALGDLWRQELAGGEAVRITEAEGTEEYPTFSPAGHELAFVYIGPDETRTIELLDLHTGELRSIDVPPDFYELSWSQHGELLGIVERQREVIAIDPSDGSQRLLAEVSRWDPNAQLSADGRTLYFQADASGAWATKEMPDSMPGGWLYRLRLDDSSEPEPLLPVGNDGFPAWISPDEQWVAVGERNRLGVRLASLGQGLVADADIKRFSAEGGRGFAFTPDGSALLYVSGSTLWRHPLGGGVREEIPIRLSPQAPTPPPVLLRHVRVLDFAAGGFGHETSLLVEGGRVRSIGTVAEQQLPPGTVTLEADGRYAIPGLFDTHTHGRGCSQRGYIGYGVTSVRNMGYLLAVENSQADQSDFTADPVPRCFYAGELIEGMQGKNGRGFLHPYDEEDTRAIVRLLSEQGAQFIKLYHVLPWPLQRAASDEARRLGLPVAAHAKSVEEVTKGVTLGYASLTHGHGRFYDDVLQMFAHAGTRWEPTQGTAAARYLLLREEPERFTVPLRQLPIGDEALMGWRVKSVQTIQAAYRHGVTLLAGTDYWPSGLPLHWELEFFVDAGISPLEVLRIATQTAAEAVGAGAQLGTLEVGKLADIVLLDANPLEDIKNTVSAWRVIKGGWVFDAEELRPDYN